MSDFCPVHCTRWDACSDCARVEIESLRAKLEAATKALEAKQAEFIRMENAWREELETWYSGQDVPPQKALLVNLNEKLKAALKAIKE